MIVTCTRLGTLSSASASASASASLVNDGWVTIGRNYLVLGVYGRSNTIKYRILGDDDRTPALQLAEQFEITSPEIPADWIFRVYSPSEWEILPAAWSIDGFWMAYFDGEPSAKAIFEQEVSAMKRRITDKVA